MKAKLRRLLPALLLFGLALPPRLYDLRQFMTADEAKWVYRSAQFLAALWQGDLAATSVNLTPAVTTTWLGSLGLGLYYWSRRAAIELPFTAWLLSLAPFRTELDLLVMARWPVVIFSALGVVGIYLAARRLFPPGPAFLGAALIALDPYPVALSRVLGHDAPAIILMSLAVLLLLAAVRSPRPGPLVLAGLVAGLAFLSKAPALFLIPFAVLLFAWPLLRQRVADTVPGDENPATLPPSIPPARGEATPSPCQGEAGRGSSGGLFPSETISAARQIRRFLLWLLTAYLAFVVVWPAAWVDPVGRPAAVIQNAFLSATDDEEAAEEGYWAVPDLGPFYYPVHGAFKLSPLVMVGVGLALYFVARQDAARRGAAWLIAFALLFGLFMTLGDKRSPRYIAPVFPALALVAAFGWTRLYEAVLSQTRPAYYRAYLGVLILSALVILIPVAPYYFTYFNPLVGGRFTAPRWVKLGWGEGLDQMGRFLQRELPDSRVGTPYASTVALFFEGDLSAVDGDHLDYVTLYIKQIQSGLPSPTFIRYFEQQQPVFSVALDGIHYADLHKGPALQPALSLTPGLDHAILPKPIAFRPLAPYGAIGQPVTVDVVWRADDPLPAGPSTVTLEPLDSFNFLEEDNHLDGTAATPRPLEILAAGSGRLVRLANGLVVSQHRLTPPDDLARGSYALRVDGRPLGEIELRRFRPPDGIRQVENVRFGDQISLIAYQFNPTERFVHLRLAWRAEKARLPDYTVFVQLWQAETNERIAGVDIRPVEGTWPTDRWVKGEVVVDDYFVPVPADLSPGFYKLAVGLYHPQSGQRLILPDGLDFWLIPWTFIYEG